MKIAFVALSIVFLRVQSVCTYDNSAGCKVIGADAAIYDWDKPNDTPKPVRVLCLVDSTIQSCKDQTKGCWETRDSVKRDQSKSDIYWVISKNSSTHKWSLIPYENSQRSGGMFQMALKKSDNSCYKYDNGAKANWSSLDTCDECQLSNGKNGKGYYFDKQKGFSSVPNEQRLRSLSQLLI